MGVQKQRRFNNNGKMDLLPAGVLSQKKGADCYRLPKVYGVGFFLNEKQDSPFPFFWNFSARRKI